MSRYSATVDANEMDKIRQRLTALLRVQMPMTAQEWTIFVTSMCFAFEIAIRIHASGQLLTSRSPSSAHTDGSHSRCRAPAAERSPEPEYVQPSAYSLYRQRSL